jgi:chemotaxis protein CheX
MNVEYINPFVRSVLSVFSTMLNCGLTRGQPFVKDSHQPLHEVSGVIGLSGKAKGIVVLSLDREAALQATQAMLGERPLAINADVTDAVGELTNMIAGNAKAQLEQYALNVSLPTVITGKGHCIDFPKDATAICIPFDCPWGEINVEVGLVELQAPVPAAAN